MIHSSKGVVVLARNNGRLDYVKQAVYLAERVKKYLNLPTTIITDSSDYLENKFGSDMFDKVIKVDYFETRNNRAFFDGSLSHKTAPFKNDMRDCVYGQSPYDETLLLDTDFIISNNTLLNCFNSDNDLMMFKDSHDLSRHRPVSEFKRVSDYTIDFYWATVIFFRKTYKNQLLFDLVRHIKQEWNHYRRVYQIDSGLFRNDFAFSIAIHIMNGFSKGNLVTPLPSKHYYITDKDILLNIDGDKMTFLLEKERYLGEYTLIKTEGLNVHVMNKFSLERVIDGDSDRG